MLLSVPQFSGAGVFSLLLRGPSAGVTEARKGLQKILFMSFSSGPNDDGNDGGFLSRYAWP